ncbi:hypothetical protein [uncultured Victivallis sp.]|uniref:hypothetical protein n=1 Tax=uncultured Victivallis sp. TaxID=354118 RepID=UPI0025E47ACB|nr:hypothetical protein [uncultured Victivallis sp.]
MKNRISLTAALLLLICGCAPTITVNDVTYEALTQEEEAHLVTAARAMLVKPGKMVSKEEIRLVQQTEPKLEITYTDDRSGTAEVSWQAPEKIITVFFEGEFMSPTVSVSVSTEKRQPEILKFTAPTP